MPIVPDVKNWTWVLERVCPECGFDAAATAYEVVPALARDSADRLRAVLERPDARRRPDESTWSPLEYAAHVRDVCRIFAYRTAVATRTAAVDPRVPAFDARGLTADETPDGLPVFSNWDQDATAIADRYDMQEPVAVSGELALAAEAAARAFEAVPVADRDLRVRRGDGSFFTVDSLAKYFAHDLVHHVHDVRG
ncbi:DinB family protein [Nocardia xishanensis]|uniref:DinB family protein n=1 Tax=Nocardia xishanensis TaxID=238964 RepID=UPI00082A97A5|nr:DinB family protein [Nocardia xishanensis]